MSPNTKTQRSHKGGGTKNGTSMVSLAWFWPTPYSNSHGDATSRRGEWGSAEGRSKKRPDARSLSFSPFSCERDIQLSALFLSQFGRSSASLWSNMHRKVTRSPLRPGKANAHQRHSGSPQNRLKSRKQAVCSTGQGKCCTSRVGDGKEKSF